MRALRYYGPGDIRLEHGLPEPICQSYQIKIRPSFCGICGSDVHAYQSDATPFKSTPHPITGETWPITLGHEFSGDVIQVGAGAQVTSGLEVGDRVAVQPTICCNRCTACKDGSTNCCESFGFLGFMGWGGGLSDYVCVDARFVFKLPETIPSNIGALIEPLAVAWHAITQSPPKAGDNILIMGAGPIGLAVLQCLKAYKPAQVIVAEVSSNRRKFAQQFGASSVINPQDEEVVSKCKLLCNGAGPDIAFDCAGAPASIKSACLAVRSKGTVVNVAVWEGEIPFDMTALLFGEKKLFSALSYTTSDFENVIEALRNGSMKPRGLITRTISIDRVVEDGIHALIHEKDKDIKILVDVRK